jgi:hypothetical protein
MHTYRVTMCRLAMYASTCRCGTNLLHPWLLTQPICCLVHVDVREPRIQPGRRLLSLTSTCNSRRRNALTLIVGNAFGWKYQARHDMTCICPGRPDTPLTMATPTRQKIQLTCTLVLQLANRPNSFILFLYGFDISFLRKLV